VRSALFALGFRPFYLLAALFAAVAVPAWVADVAGHGWRAGYLDGLDWHQHEMVFGFVLAVMAGFLLTAVRVWTGRAMPSGPPLALLAAHWLAARVLMLTGPGWLGALVDGALPFALAAVLARPILAARNRRNYFVPALLAVLGAVNAGFHLSALALVAIPASLWAQGGLYLELLLLIVMAGRVVPSFAGNALPQAKLHRSVALDRAALALSVVALACALAGLGGWLTAAPAFAAAALHAARQAGWAPLATRARPILWILHLSHAWIPVGFALLGLAAFGIAPRDAALHAFAIGALSGTIVGMITRTALGHTGRPLVAGGAEILAYVLVLGAALLRVAAALVLTAYMPFVIVSAALWSAAFLAYFVAYAPRLTRPRLDGKPG
jgi:uncharacterized protein involved in response to NO